MLVLGMPYNVNQFATRRLFELPVAVFDFETTGVDTNQCRAVEMAIVHLDLGLSNVKTVYRQRFNPGVPIPAGASNVHGIYDKDVLDEPTFIECWPDIQSHLEGRVLAAYNLPFDWQLLNQEYRKGCIWKPTQQIQMDYGEQMFGICGLVMARAIDRIKGRGVHKLEKVCLRRGIELSNAHEASADAVATGQLIEVLLREVSQQRRYKFDTVRDFWAWQRIEGIRQEERLRRWLVSKNRPSPVWPWTDY
jgi:DNA polymerase-3 subunit epsilon